MAGFRLDSQRTLGPLRIVGSRISSTICSFRKPLQMIHFQGNIWEKTMSYRALAILTLFVLPAFAANEGQLTDAERDVLVTQLEQSKKGFLDSISGLSAAQWRFKPAKDRWSVQECAEHVILAEDMIFDGATANLKTAAVPRPANSNAEFDQKLIAGVHDRTHKLTAPEPLVPSGTRFATPEDAARAFSEKRDRHIEYAKTTQDPLRVHVMKGPIGDMDDYQFLLLMAAHSARHTAQIKEVEASPDYPKAAAQNLFTVPAAVVGISAASHER
jgi:hypothetical protein